MLLWNSLETTSILLLVPPEKPKIYEERGQEVRLKLGPYKIGDTILLKCVASGGKKNDWKTVIMNNNVIGWTLGL